MTVFHNLGFPRIGKQRELKKAVEAYWNESLSQDELVKIAKELRQTHWSIQKEAGVAALPVGDFAWYDHILEWTTTLGVVPARFNHEAGKKVDLDTLFRMARGRAPQGEPAAACEMTKWFDTNYHYIVPELDADQYFYLARDEIFEQIKEAQKAGLQVKPVIPGPLTWLWLSKGDSFTQGAADEAKLALLPKLLVVYQEILTHFAELGVEWVQIDEPVLVLDINQAWQQAYIETYQTFNNTQTTPKLLVATYFESVQHQLETIKQLPVAGLHIDIVRAPQQLNAVVEALQTSQVLSVGAIDGRNIWRSNLDTVATKLEVVKEKLGDRLWLAPSCSLLHVPVDAELETGLDTELHSWLSFAVQKLEELRLLTEILDGHITEKDQKLLVKQRAALQNRAHSSRTHNPALRAKHQKIDQIVRQRPDFKKRVEIQRAYLKLPAFPTTTIGSFPQTTEIRQLRREWREGNLGDLAYEKAIQAEVEQVIRFQEEVGIDVLVHGEAERNDMVEYFGELLGGFAFTQNGWVQSYGTRCVKPPIIFGDVLRAAPMTVAWSAYAQSLTNLPVKGMLTGPVTMLQWSFVRDDQSRQETCQQLALALRDEVNDLEAAGINVIQIDEPAIREGLPLRKSDWTAYLDWAVDCFRITTGGVKDSTQIHTHMCYSEFNDIIESIAVMDADVITIETSRSNMELLEAFENFDYPNDIGPGVYDIHSPNIPDQDWMVSLMKKAGQKLPAERLWVNPDCGLKTRGWPETKAALIEMVAAARHLRETL